MRYLLFVLVCLLAACKTDNAPAPQPAPSSAPPTAPSTATTPPTPETTATPPTPPTPPPTETPELPKDPTAVIPPSELARVDPNPPTFVTPPSQAVLDGMKAFCAIENAPTEAEGKVLLDKWRTELPKNSELAALFHSALNQKDSQAIATLHRAATNVAAKCVALDEYLVTP